MPYGYTSVDKMFTVEGDKIGRRKITRDKCVLIVALVSTIMSLAAISMVMFVFFIQGSAPLIARDAQGAIVCISCARLMKNPYDSTSSLQLLSQLTHINDDGIVKCCVYNSEQMAVLLELMLQEPDLNQAPLSEFNPKDFTFSPVSAHKMLHPPVEINNLTVPYFENDSLVITHCDPQNNDRVEHARGVEVTKEGLRILYPGLYFIYSSIYYSPQTGRPCKEFKFQTWGHYVEKIVKNYPGRSGCLLKTLHTCCDDCTNDKETGFTSGVFYLEAGSFIRVSISGHGLVSFEKQASFIGLMMLGSGSKDGDEVDRKVLSNQNSNLI